MNTLDGVSLILPGTSSCCTPMLTVLDDIWLSWLATCPSLPAKLLFQCNAGRANPQFALPISQCFSQPSMTGADDEMMSPGIAIPLHAELL